MTLIDKQVNEAYTNVFGIKTQREITLRKRIAEAKRIYQANKTFSFYKICREMEKNSGHYVGTIYRYFRDKKINLEQIIR